MKATSTAKHPIQQLARKELIIALHNYCSLAAPLDWEVSEVDDLVAKVLKAIDKTLVSEGVRVGGSEART